MPTQRRLSVAKIFPLIALGYIGMQVYAAVRAYSGLGLAPSSVPWLAAFVLLMTYMPVLLRRIERRGWHYSAEVVAWVGYTWMGFVFLFFWIALGLDLFGWVVGAASAILPASIAAQAPSLRMFPTALGVTLAVAAYGLLDARRVRVERVRLASPKVATRNRPFRVALISDVHLGVLVGPRRLRRMVERLRALDADVVLSAGDLVDGQADRVSLLVPLLDALRPRHGKFAVTGNHDYYAGIEHALDFHARAGFHVLSGTAADVGEDIRIAGVDDPTSKRMGMWSNVDERVPLNGGSKDRFTILLKHQPIVDPRAAGMFDLQLSGHVHRGQIFPFYWLVRLVYPVRTGLSRLTGGGWLYVSRGTGTWGPPMRVGASPEITLIEINPA
ncbi:MAG TPA: metallophosphoesterase [Burkholderiales bacterium]